jgi:hypothetical protein
MVTSRGRREASSGSRRTRIADSETGRWTQYRRTTRHCHVKASAMEVMA